MDNNEKIVSWNICNKKQKIYRGRRLYKANEAIRCYRDTHNNVDIHNQLCAYGSWDYKTRRKQMRVPHHTLIDPVASVEIGFSLFVSFAVVNAYIGWKNHVLKDKPDREKLKKSIQYGVRNFRLKLIQRWAKKAMRHYAKTRPHKKKRRKLVNPTYVCLKSVVWLPWAQRAQS